MSDYPGPMSFVLALQSTETACLYRLLQICKHGEVPRFIEAKHTAGHEVISNNGALRIERKRDLQVPRPGSSPQTSHMPLQLPSIQAQSFCSDQRLWIPLLDVKSQIDQALRYLSPKLQVPPAHQSVSRSAMVADSQYQQRPGLAGFVDKIQSNLSDVVPVYPG